MDSCLYGVDWGGPIPLFDDEGTVNVEELVDVLTEQQKSDLQGLLATVSTSNFSQQEMLGRFVLAKSFVHQLPAT